VVVLFFENSEHVLPKNMGGPLTVLLLVSDTGQLPLLLLDGEGALPAHFENNLAQLFIVLHSTLFGRVVLVVV